MSAQVSSSSIQHPPTVPSSLKAERIQLWLEEMPGWKLSCDGRRVRRHFRFPSRGESLTFLRHAIKSAEATEVAFGRRGPGLAYRGDLVTVSIWSNQGSFTEADLHLARLVSQPS